MNTVAATEATEHADLRDPITGMIFPLEAAWPLHPGDRCDAPGSVAGADGRLHSGTCGAEALVRAWIPGISRPLFFCGHHFRIHQPALARIGAYVHDERSRLNSASGLPAPVSRTHPAGHWTMHQGH